MKNKLCILCVIIFGLIIFVCSCSNATLSQHGILSQGATSSQVTSPLQMSLSSQYNSISQIGSSSQTISSSQSIPGSPIGKPSQMCMISAGLTGMYHFFCFDGSIYRIVGSSEVNQYASTKPERALVFDPSELSKKPIGSVYSPLEPGAKDTFPVYRVNGVPILKGVSKSRSIAILMGQQFYCRADYFMSDRITFNNQQYLIVPVILGGAVTQSSLLPYKVDKKIGTTNDRFDVYSLINPEKLGEIAIDISGMSSGNLYPMAIPDSNAAIDSNTITKSSEPSQKQTSIQEISLLSNLKLPDKIIYYHNGKQTVFSKDDTKFENIINLNIHRNTNKLELLEGSMLIDKTAKSICLLEYNYDQTGYKPIYIPLISYNKQYVVTQQTGSNSNYSQEYGFLSSPDKLIDYLNN